MLVINLHDIISACIALSIFIDEQTLGLLISVNFAYFGETFGIFLVN